MRFSTSQGDDFLFVAYKSLRDFILNKALGICPVNLLKLKSLEEEKKIKGHKAEANIINY